MLCAKDLSRDEFMLSVVFLLLEVLSKFIIALPPMDFVLMSVFLQCILSMVREYTQIRLASNWHIWFHITSIMSRFLSGFCMLFLMLLHLLLIYVILNCQLGIWAVCAQI